MLRPEFTKQFKRDYKVMMKRGKDAKKLEEVLASLCQGAKLPEVNRDHALTNSRNYRGVRECHIESDWLLVYTAEPEAGILKLVRTGTHSDLF